MKIIIISFTKAGALLAEEIRRGLFGEGLAAEAVRKQEIEESLGEWTKKAFAAYDALVFVGATGIAVRAIAPYVKDKFTDPAVIAVDEKGHFVISLLSGHVGGANELASGIAPLVGGQAVITTATDVNGAFAVDVFAKKNGLLIESRRLAKLISAGILEGQKIPIFAGDGIEIDASHMPGELVLVSSEEFIEARGLRIAVSDIRFCPDEDVLYLIPIRVTAGMGCKKGTEKATIRRKLSEAFAKHQVFEASIEKICSIDVKAEEEGLIGLSRELSVPFECFSAEELLSLSGSFSASGFVKQTVGVDCVCERSAVYGSESGSLIFRKTPGDGVTVAAARKRIRISFE